MNIKYILKKKIKIKWFFIFFILFSIIVTFFSYLFIKEYNTKESSIIENKNNSNIHLNRYYHFTRLMNNPNIELYFRKFISNYDNSNQNILIMKPSNNISEKIFFFFHGMDGDSGDCIVVQDLVTKLNAIIIGLGGRGPSWLSDAFLSDAEQIIADYSKDFKGYYLIGVSMGGTQVLSLPGLLPENLKKKILGVFSFIPGSDLVLISRYSSNERVKNTLKDSVNGDALKLKKRSAINLINNYKKSIPFVIFYDKNDTVLLSDSLKDYINKLNEHCNLSLYSETGEHNFQYTKLDYLKIFNELGKNSLIEKPLPILEVK